MLIRLFRSCVGLFLLFLLLSSCAKRVPELTLSKIEAEEVLNKVNQAQKGVRSVRGTATVRVTSPEGKTAFKQVTIAKEPDLLHLEARGVFGKSAALVVSDGLRTIVLSSEERAIYLNLEEIDLSYLIHPDFPLKITPADLANLLLGRLPKELYTDDIKVKFSKGSNQYIIQLTNGGGEETILWVNSRNYRTQGARIRLEGGEWATLRFSNFKEIEEGVNFPMLIGLQFDRFSVLLNYDEGVEVNKSIEESVFSIEPYARILYPFDRRSVTPNPLSTDTAFKNKYKENLR